MLPAPAKASPADAPPVRRRRVFYVPGYDPRSPRAYYLLFRKELRRFAALNGVRASLVRVREPERPGRPSAEWRLVAEWSGGPVETTIEFLDWHDLPAADFAMGRPRRLLLAARVLWDSTIHGAIAAMWRLNWKFGLFALYPWAMFALYVAGGIGALAAAAALLGALGLPAPAVAAALAALAYGLARLTAALDRRFYVWYLVNDWIFTWRHRTGRHPEADARFELFARRLASRAGAGDVDETLVVGHSSGAFVATLVIARALELNPELGRPPHVPVLLTLGANTPIAAAGRDDPPIRRAIAALVASDRVRWADYYAPQDVLNFPALDPVAAYGLDLGGRPARNPDVRSAKMKEILSPETDRRQRWRFYDRHFQFIRANDVPGDYDFYRFLAGPGRFPW